jgi:hypothetical protein
MHTTSLFEWGAAFGLASLLWASCAAAVAALVPVDFAAIALQAALTAAALLALLTITPEHTR